MNQSPVYVFFFERIINKSKLKIFLNSSSLVHVQVLLVQTRWYQKKKIKNKKFKIKSSVCESSGYLCKIKEGNHWCEYKTLKHYL